jgi:hypothetical protein
MGLTKVQFVALYYTVIRTFVLYIFRNTVRTVRSILMMSHALVYILSFYNPPLLRQSCKFVTENFINQRVMGFYAFWFGKLVPTYQQHWLLQYPEQKKKFFRNVRNSLPNCVTFLKISLSLHYREFLTTFRNRKQENTQPK